MDGMKKKGKKEKNYAASKRYRQLIFFSLSLSIFLIQNITDIISKDILRTIFYSSDDLYRFIEAYKERKGYVVKIKKDSDDDINFIHTIADQIGNVIQVSQKYSN